MFQLQNLLQNNSNQNVAKDRHMKYNREPKINPHTNSRLIFDKHPVTVHQLFQQTVLKKLSIYVQRNKVGCFGFIFLMCK